MKILAAFIAGMVLTTAFWTFLYTPRLDYTLVEEIAKNDECAVIVIGHSNKIEGRWTSFSRSPGEMGGYKVITYSSREKAESKLKEILQEVEP